MVGETIRKIMSESKEELLNKKLEIEKRLDTIKKGISGKLEDVIHKQHLDLRELFLRHQEFLLQGQFDKALASLNHYDVCHQVHARLEERYLFPEFVKIKRKSRWDVSLYEKEHEKIESLFENISNDLQWLSEQQINDSQLRRNIIALLDMEKTFKGLTEHHEEREEGGMLKDMDEQLEQALLDKLGSDIKSAWMEAIASITEKV